MKKKHHHKGRRNNGSGGHDFIFARHAVETRAHAKTLSQWFAQSERQLGSSSDERLLPRLGQLDDDTDLIAGAWIGDLHDDLAVTDVQGPERQRR